MIATIEKLIGPPLKAMGFRLVQVRFDGGQAPTLQIMAERRGAEPQGPGDGGVTVQDCAEISRAISPILDIADTIPGNYTLEVSSPGIDRPLVRLEDFERFAGFEARIETTRPIDGRKRFRGTLQGVSGDRVQVALESGDELVELPFAEVASAKLILTDALVAASLKAREHRAPQPTT